MDSVLRNNFTGQVKLRIRIIYFVKNRLLRTDARAVRPPPFRIYAILEHLQLGIIDPNYSFPKFPIGLV